MPAIQPAAQPINAPTELALNALRQHGGVASGTGLQADLCVSQPTVSCALALLLHTGRVRKVGAARSLRCLVPRATGQRHGGLPWFLNDTGPQGFMGRTFAAAHPDLKIGINPAKWTDDEVLRAMAFYGDDLPGNLVGREAAFEHFHTLTQHAPVAGEIVPRGVAARPLQPTAATLGDWPRTKTLAVAFWAAAANARISSAFQRFAMQNLNQIGWWSRYLLPG